jgi:hypothetical protein
MTSIASSARRSSLLGYERGRPSLSAARSELAGEDDVTPRNEARAERDARLWTSAMKPPPMKPATGAGRARVTSVVMSSILTQDAHLLPVNAQKYLVG